MFLLLTQTFVFLPSKDEGKSPKPFRGPGRLFSPTFWHTTDHGGLGNVILPAQVTWQDSEFFPRLSTCLSVQTSSMLGVSAQWNRKRFNTPTDTDNGRIVAGEGNGYNLEIIFFPMVGVSHRQSSSNRARFHLKEIVCWRAPKGGQQTWLVRSGFHKPVRWGWLKSLSQIGMANA